MLVKLTLPCSDFHCCNYTEINFFSLINFSSFEFFLSQVPWVGFMVLIALGILCQVDF